MKSYVNPEMDVWYHTQLNNPANFPFSFTYSGIRYDGFSSGVFRQIARQTIYDVKKETNELVMVLPDGLQVTLQASYYPAYGAAEWVVWFENTGYENSDILERLEST